MAKNFVRNPIETVWLTPMARRACAGLVMIGLLFSPLSLSAQAEGGIISGTVINAAGRNVPSAVITITSLANGQTTQVTANARGHYDAPALPPGQYRITARAGNWHAPASVVTIQSGARQTVNLAVNGPPESTSPAPVPAPAQIPQLSLQNLGFSPQQTQGSRKLQARLNRRSRMLQIHQKLGLLTMIPLAATVIAGGFAGGRPSKTSSTGRNIHAILGLTAFGMYSATAYYAIFAPRIKGVKTRGPIKVHEALAWIHGPGMILTPILGEMAYAQRARGERVHGIAKLHGLVAMVTLGAYVAAWLAVAKPHLFSSSTQRVSNLFSRTSQGVLGFLGVGHETVRPVDALVRRGNGK